MRETFSKQDTQLAKGVAILLMLWFHCFLEPTRFEGFDVSFFPFTKGQGMALATLGKCCVGIFAFLSGYGMTCSYRKRSAGLEFTLRDAKELTIRRWINLMGGFWVAYLFSFLVCSLQSSRTPLDLYTDGESDPMLFAFYALLDALGLSHLMDTPSLIYTWWYMGFALALIFSFPFLLRLCRRWDWLAVPAVLLLHCALRISVNTFSRWFLLAMLGILFARHDLLARWRNGQIFSGKMADKIARFALLTSGMALVAWYQMWNYGNNNYITLFLDALMALAVILWCDWFLAPLPVVQPVLCFLGRHSMNLFLIHNFIRGYWLHDLIYSMPHFLLSVALLTLLSLAVSFLLEGVKKLVGYHRLMERLQAWLLGKCCIGGEMP